MIIKSLSSQERDLERVREECRELHVKAEQLLDFALRKRLSLRIPLPILAPGGMKQFIQLGF